MCLCNPAHVTLFSPIEKHSVILFHFKVWLYNNNKYNTPFLLTAHTGLALRGIRTETPNRNQPRKKCRRNDQTDHNLLFDSQHPSELKLGLMKSVKNRTDKIPATGNRGLRHASVRRLLTHRYPNRAFAFIFTALLRHGHILGNSQLIKDWLGCVILHLMVGQPIHRRNYLHWSVSKSRFSTICSLCVGSEHAQKCSLFAHVQKVPATVASLQALLILFTKE